MSLRIRLLSATSATVLFAAILLAGSATSRAQNSDVNLALHANSHASAAEVGLPVYPGAALYKKAPDDDSAVDLGFSFGDSHFRLMAVSYITSDSPEKVLAFYRKPLSRYGQVLECDHGRAVGAITVTGTGLTCSDEHGGHAQINGSVDSSSDRELRAGFPNKYRIVGIDKSQPGSTRFGLVYLEIPKDSSKTTD